MEAVSIIAPSILACDWSRFGEEAANAVDAGGDWLHVDVMDGHFVPPITFGAGVVEGLRRRLPNTELDVHLMIEQPERQLEMFAKAGATGITVHLETCPHLHRTLEQIKQLGCRCGVAINPATPVEGVRDVIGITDLILIMTVNPGWGGQRYIEHSDAKIKEAREMIALSRREIYLEVDGGIDSATIKRARSAGANVFVAGTSIFKAPNYREAIASLR